MLPFRNYCFSSDSGAFFFLLVFFFDDFLAVAFLVVFFSLAGFFFAGAFSSVPAAPVVSLPAANTIGDANIVAPNKIAVMIERTLPFIF